MAAGANSPLLLLRSPLGDDTLPFAPALLHAIELDATEQISRPFEITLTAVSTRRAVDPEELLTRDVTVTVRRRDGTDRLFNGVVARMDAIGADQRGRWEYRLLVVPRLWFMDQTLDCRIFQQRTVVEILRELFAEHGVAPVEFRIFGTQSMREYTTQFDETDLRFAHRLMQEAGYFYFFEHTASEHRLVVTDANQAFAMLAHPLHRVIALGNNVDIIDRWESSLSTTFGAVRLQDYDPTRPSTPVMGRQTTTLPTAGASRRDVFRWPASTLSNSVAGDRARFRMEAAEAAASLRRGHGFDPAFLPGYRFVLASDPTTGAADVDLAIRSTRHHARDRTWLGGTEPAAYDCDFTCFRQATRWREDLTLGRPAMTGIFSAVVLGEAGEEIHADRLARVKVRPLFDYRRETVAGMAIWVRILHAWAGNDWGWQHLPRVGTEVGLSFMNGDPDNPVVVGAFYNEEMMPPFAIPAEQTKNGFRSRSTLHGGRQDYNELSFDDRIGAELVLLHAQRDHDVSVERDQSVSIGRDRTVVTERNDSLTSTIGDISVTADEGRVSITAATEIVLTVGATMITLTPDSITAMTDGAMSFLAGGAITLTAGGAIALSAGAAVTVEATADVNLSAAAAVTIEAVGAVNIAGSEVSIEALDGAVVCLPFPI